MPLGEIVLEVEESDEVDDSLSLVGGLVSYGGVGEDFNHCSKHLHGILIDIFSPTPSSITPLVVVEYVFNWGL